MKRTLAFGVVIVAVVVALVLSSRRQMHTPVLQVVPKQAAGVVYVPHLDDLVAHLRAVARTLEVSHMIDGLLAGVGDQLGFDPSDPEALSARGLDAHGPVVVFTEKGGHASAIALEVVDRGAFEKALVGLLHARAGAKRADAEVVHGVRVERAVAGKDVAAAWAYRGKVVVLSAGAGAEARVAGAASTSRGESLSSTPAFARARTQLGQGADLLMFTGGAGLSEIDPDLHGARAAAVTLTASGAGLSLDAFFDVGEQGAKTLVGLTGKADARTALRDVGEKAILVARASVDLPAAWAEARRRGLPPRVADLEAALEKKGLKVPELLALSDGTAIAEVRLSPHPDLTTMPTLDPSRTNPFHYVRATLLLPVKDASKVGASLPLVADTLAPALSAKITKVTIEGHPAFTVHYQLGEGMTFGLVQKTLVVAGGDHAFADAADQVGAGSDAFAKTLADPKTVTRLAKGGLVAGVVDVDTLLAAVKGLPDSSLGGGTVGVILRSILDRVTAPLSHLARVDFGVTPGAEGVRASVDVVFHVPPGGNAG